MADRNDQIVQICRLFRARTEENKQSVKLLLEKQLYSVAIGVLRQEIDSLIRISYLSSKSHGHSKAQARQMVRDLIDGEQWTRISKKGKPVRVTDREMLEAYSKAIGWEKIVYEFGCKLIHLSNLHDYKNADPILSLSESKKVEIVSYLTQYHGYNESNLNLESLIGYLPKVIDKICENTNCFVDSFEKVMLEKLS